MEKVFTVIADILYAKDDLLHIEGRCNVLIKQDEAETQACFPDDFDIVLRDGKGASVRAEKKRTQAFDVLDDEGKVSIPGMTFSVEMQTEAGMRFSFVIRDEGSGKEYPAKIKLGRYSQLSSARGYYLESGHCIFKREGNAIAVTKNSLLTRTQRKRELEKALREAGRQDIEDLRKRALKLKKGKPIWLLTDRADKAGDNAEAFFKYLSKNGAMDKYRVVFAVNEDSPDFAKMQQYGEVVPYGSDEYLALYLAADKFISSQWTYESPTNPTLNPFRKDRKYVKDLMTGDFIFLQHGVIMNDLSRYGHKLKRNVRLFITSAHGEYESIASERYGYTGDEVVLTGLARHDQLRSAPDKTILFMPTRRSGLERLTEDELKASDYYRFYNGMINDPRLLKAMEKHGFTGVLVLHPVLVNTGVYKAFEANEYISIAEKGAVDYTALFEKGSMLVSDYSSTTVDFAYLKQPVIYTQYDRDTFFAGQIYDSGYFSYEDDGFGPVCYDYETAISEIISCIESGCMMNDIYKKRVEEFFAYTDRDNCKRIYEAIEGINEGTRGKSSWKLKCLNASISPTLWAVTAGISTLITSRL